MESRPQDPNQTYTAVTTLRQAKTLLQDLDPGGQTPLNCLKSLRPWIRPSGSRSCSMISKAREEENRRRYSRLRSLIISRVLRKRGPGQRDVVSSVEKRDT